MLPSDTLPILVLALACEAAVGYPGSLYRAIGHPVTWIGRLIASLDDALNRHHSSQATRRANGVLTLAILVLSTGLAAAAMQDMLRAIGLPGVVAVALIASTLLAQRSLHDHVRAVADGLRADGIGGGRSAVSMIVGRNPAMLDESGVCRAAIESLAENFSDGVVAPAFWLGAAGLPGAMVYKAVNTADSMIGHRTERHEAFGCASARFDDLVNLPASRLAALLLILAAALQRGASASGAMRAVRRDSRRHRSPNAGWPEAAMAGALGLRLAGPRVYGTARVDDGWMGDGRAEATAADIDRALALYRTACGLLIAISGALAVIAWVVAH